MQHTKKTRHCLESSLSLSQIKKNVLKKIYRTKYLYFKITILYLNGRRRRGSNAWFEPYQYALRHTIAWCERERMGAQMTRVGGVVCAATLRLRTCAVRPLL